MIHVLLDTWDRSTVEQDGDTKAFYKCGDSTDLGEGERGIRSMCTLNSFETKILSKTAVIR